MLLKVNDEQFYEYVNRILVAIKLAKNRFDLVKLKHSIIHAEKHANSDHRIRACAVVFEEYVKAIK